MIRLLFGIHLHLAVSLRQLRFKSCLLKCPSKFKFIKGNVKFTFTWRTQLIHTKVTSNYTIVRAQLIPKLPHIITLGEQSIVIPK